MSCLCDTVQSGGWLPIADMTPQCLAYGYLLLTRHHGVWQMVTYGLCNTTESGRRLPMAYVTPQSLEDGYLLLMNYAVWQMVTYCCHDTSLSGRWLPIAVIFRVKYVSMAWNHQGKEVQPNPQTMPLFYHCSLWWYVKGCSNLKYGIGRNFCLLTFTRHHAKVVLYWGLTVIQ